MNDRTLAATRVVGPHVWSRDSFRDSREFSLVLEPAAIAEIDESIAALRRSGKQWDQITQADMPLPSFARMAREIRREVTGTPGRGFVVLRGLDPQRYAKDEMKSIYWALGAHLGKLIPQTLKGELMATVADRGYADDLNVKNSLTNRAIGYHTDTVILGKIETVCLLCLTQAETGGESRLASAAAVYNAIADEAPELIEALAHDYPIDRRLEFTADMGPTANAPLLQRDGHLVRTQCHHKLMLTGAAKVGRVFTQAEAAAIEKMNDVLARDEITFEYKLQAGEMLFASNDLVLHDRARWVDPPDPAKKRHLERMWLAAL